MPSVVMKDGTRSPIVIRPIVSPISAQTASAATIASGSGTPEIVDVFHQERRQREYLADRQIDLAADQQHDLAAGDDDRRGDELRQRLHVGGGDEIGVGDFEINDERHRDDDDARLRPQQQRVRPAGEAARRAGLLSRLAGTRLSRRSRRCAGRSAPPCRCPRSASWC